MTHTPTPWRSLQSMSRFLMFGANGATVAATLDNGSAAGMEMLRSGESEANAAFIVTACNAYEANVARIAELESALSTIGGCGIEAGRMLDKYEARIAELEAALRQLADESTSPSDGDATKKPSREALRLARAALAKGRA